MNTRQRKLVPLIRLTLTLTALWGSPAWSGTEIKSSDMRNPAKEEDPKTRKPKPPACEALPSFTMEPEGLNREVNIVALTRPEFCEIMESSLEEYFRLIECSGPEDEERCFRWVDQFNRLADSYAEPCREETSYRVDLATKFTKLSKFIFCSSPTPIDIW